MTTYFAKVEAVFPPPTDDGNVPTEAFLEASKEIIPMIDALGTAFLPIYNDVDGNIRKLTKCRSVDPERFSTLRAMLENDIKRKNTRHKDSATSALLWLKRALQFILVFFEEITRDHQSGNPRENLVPVARKAYEDSLKRYHGWIVQKIFALVAHAIPWRKDLLATLALGEEGREDEVIAGMESFIPSLRGVIHSIQAMYVELNLDFQEKV